MFNEILTYVHLNSDKIENIHPTMTKGKYEISFVIKGSTNKVLIQTINNATLVKTRGTDLFTTVTEEVISFLDKEFEHYYNIQLRGGDEFCMTASTTVFSG